MVKNTSPSPTILHQRTVGRVFNSFYTHVLDGNKGDVFVAPYDVLLSETVKVCRKPQGGFDRVAELWLEVRDTPETPLLPEWAFPLSNFFRCRRGT